MFYDDLEAESETGLTLFLTCLGIDYRLTSFSQQVFGQARVVLKSPEGKEIVAGWREVGERLVVTRAVMLALAG